MLWSKENPISSAELKISMDSFLNTNLNTKGLLTTIQNLATNGNDMWGEWWNYYSEIRCACFLSNNLSKVSEFNHPSGIGDVDLLLENTQKWDVVSFSGKSQGVKHNAISDELTITHLYNKISPKFLAQKADFVICDDIFSADSKNYPLTSYFFRDVNSYRKSEFKRIFGNMIKNILVVSFVENIFTNPRVIFKGSNIK